MVTPRSLPELLADRPSLARSMGDGLAAGIARFDRSGKLTDCNPELERILGEVPGSTGDLDLRPLGGDPEAGTSPLMRAAAGQPVRAEDFELQRRDGTARLVRISALPDSDGAEPGAVWLTLLDLGERKSLDVLRSQILGVVAHDLRNPLSAMRMSLAMMVKKVEMPTERRLSLAERMLGTLSRMEALVSSLVEQAHADAGGELRLKREPASLGDIYDRVQRDLDLLFPGRTIEVERRGSLEGSWDVARLERVLTNLFTNALKHGREDRPVRVVFDGEGESNIQITVHNEGQPIARELLPVVFEPFTIGGLEKQERRRNIGLGLFVVKHIVRAHGGEVTVSSNEQEGTTFIATLPRSEGARSQAAVQGDARGPSGSL